MLQTTIFVLKIFYLFDISCFHPAVFRLPVVIAGFRDTGLTADILSSSAGFDGLQNSDDLVLSESHFRIAISSGDIISMSEDLEK